MEPLFLTAEQLAQLLQVSKRTVWRMRSASQIPQPYQIGGNVRWLREDIENWLRRACSSPAISDNLSRR